ncbi:hypothetical protein [Sphingomonas sp.]|uniref:hypothetical protein n=1 Tax=Sphingomonas sp. TaxID=28214 RepID=UPI0035C82BA8
MTNEEIKAETKKIDLIYQALKWSPMIVLVGPRLLNGVDGGDIVMAIFAFFLCGISNRLLAQPVANAMFKRLTKRMLDDLSRGQPVASGYSWWNPRPGAMIITGDDRIGLVHTCTDYQPIEITPDQIMKASVEVETTTTAKTKTSGSPIIGFMGSSGIGGGWSFGRRSTTTYHQRHDYSVEIMWQTGRNAHPHCAVISAGDRTAAESMAGIVNRMVGQAPLRQVGASGPAIEDGPAAPALA